MAKKSRIYLDYASLTPVDTRVLREMGKFSTMDFANPSSLYMEGVAAKKALEDGRKRVAGFLHAHSDEIVFTSGGTEANGLALEGAGRAARHTGIEKPHLIISAIEHSSVIEAANMMEKHGVEVTRLGVDASGRISLDELKKSIKPNTFMVSIMTVNNEIGTIQPIREIAKIIRHARKGFSDKGREAKLSTYPLFHTDAAQAALYGDLNMENFGVDLLTLDASKVYGPRGMGALYVKRGTPIEPIIYGGGQERGLRSGTENIPAIMGFAKALELATSERVKESARVSELRQILIEGLKAIRSDIFVNPAEIDAAEGNGGTSPVLKSAKYSKVTTKVVTSTKSPHILNVSIPGIDSEFFVLQLDVRGIACSTKSSCLRDADESYVLKAIGANSSESVRFSFGRWTDKGDLKKALKAIKEILKK